ncbi:unnamed protein product, partial [Brenthis ino]
MELRSRLRSCNVYIITNVDFKRDCNLKISIQSNCILLNYYNNRKRRDSLSSIESLSDYSDDEMDSCVIPVHEFCHIIPNSMSCLKIDKNTISFRILTEPKNGGNFYAEFITPTDNKEMKIDKLNINLEKDDAVQFLCANCSNLISNGLTKFDRILELPTTNLDMSEWFCHGHGNTHNEVKPNKLDFLYRLTYFAIDNDILSEKANKFNSKRTAYHCNRCLAWLGVKSKNTVKLFNSEVKINQNNTEKHVFSHKNTTQSVIKDDFIYTVECMTKEFNLGMQYTMMCKIVLECTISTSKKQFLLIWVIDKELQVLKNTETRISDKVLLQSSYLTKILYKIELEMNEEVENWLADPGVVSTEISKNMFGQGVKHLEEMSLKMPESFRYTNGYCVSYLKA